jgi:hypothetical protein
LIKIITFPHRLSICPFLFWTLGSCLPPVSIPKHFVIRILIKFYIKASGKSSHSNTNSTFNRMSGLQHYFCNYFEASKTNVTLKIKTSKHFSGINKIFNALHSENWEVFMSIKLASIVALTQLKQLHFRHFCVKACLWLFIEAVIISEYCKAQWRRD